MSIIAQPYCPACGRSVVACLRWAQAMEPSDVFVIDVHPDGRVKNVLNVPTVDVECASCGTTVRLGRDTPLAAA